MATVYFQNNEITNAIIPPGNEGNAITLVLKKESKEIQGLETIMVSGECTTINWDGLFYMPTEAKMMYNGEALQIRSLGHDIMITSPTSPTLTTIFERK